MAMMADFKKFLLRGNVVDLAVAVVIGAAFGKIVTAVVDGLIMPLVAAVTPSGEWRTWSVTPLGLKLGLVLAAVIDFVIIGFALFLVVRAVQRLRPPAPAPAMRDCPFCLEPIPAKATRCRACTAEVARGRGPAPA